MQKTDNTAVPTAPEATASTPALDQVDFLLLADQLARLHRELGRFLNEIQGTPDTLDACPYPALIRHHMSGVWIAMVLGRSPLLGDKGILIDGRRIRSWTGGRLDCSDLAQQGVRPGDQLTVRRKFDLALETIIEVHPIEKRLWDYAMELK